MQDDFPADTQQSAQLLARLRREVPQLAAAVAADVGETEDLLQPVVGHVLDGLARPGRLGEAELERLRGEGAAAARAGLSVQAVIDRYLSTGWVVWDQAQRLAASTGRETLPGLAADLLRAGDDAAAALAAGYSAAERQLAARAGAARRAVIDELLLGGPADPQTTARLDRQAALVGLEPGDPHRVVAIRAPEPVEDEGPTVEAIGRILARTPGRQDHLVAARSGDLLLVLAEPWRAPASLAEIEATLGQAGAWWAASTAPVAIPDLATAWVEVRAGLDVLRRLDQGGKIVALADIALERALLADERLLRDGVETWLGPLDRAPRGGEALVVTLDAWLAAGQSVTGASRALGVGPRTVSYRLARIADLLDRPSLDAEARLHLATALLGRRLLG